VTEFEQATAVTALGRGAYVARIDPGWDIAGNANGGYLMALAARAIAAEVGRPPLSLTAHFVAPGRVGPCEIDVDVVRAGRRTATAIARVRAGGGDLLAVVGTFGDQQPGGPTVVDAAPPDLPPREQCVRSSPPVETSGFGDRTDAWVRPEDAGFRVGRPSGSAEIAGWFAFAGSDPVAEPIDVIALMLVADAFAPVCFNRAEFPVGWAPTLELTVHVRGVPAPGWLRCRFSSRFLQAGMFEEDGEVWDSTGRLVALSRQLALIPRPA
jgi:acyl-CoA thioesterase